MFSAGGGGVLWAILKIKFRGKRGNTQEFCVFRRRRRSFKTNSQTKISRKKRKSAGIPRFPQAAEEFSSKYNFAEKAEIRRNSTFSAGGWVLWEVLKQKFRGKGGNPPEFRVFRRWWRSIMRNPQTKVSRKTRKSAEIPRFPLAAEEFYEKCSK